MESSNLILQSSNILKQRNLALIGCFLMLICNLLLCLKVLFGDREIILVPNSLDAKTSLKSNSMSKSYIESLSRDVINLMLNVTPANTSYLSDSILKITHPAFYGKLKKALHQRSQNIINRKITTYFFPQAMTLKKDGKGVFIKGKLSTFLGTKRVSHEDKTYLITYSYEGFRPLLKEFYEVDAKTGKSVLKSINVGSGK